eukprot:2934517-Pyramimonas_sp.AAC.2
MLGSADGRHSAPRPSPGSQFGSLLGALWRWRRSEKSDARLSGTVRRPTACWWHAPAFASGIYSSIGSDVTVEGGATGLDAQSLLKIAPTRSK